MHKLINIWRLFLTQTFWKAKFKKLGYRTIIYKPLLIRNPQRISIGNNSHIRNLSRIEVIHRPHLGWDANLNIGSNVFIEQGAHIVCQGSITIEDNVAIAAFCSIVDTYHPHEIPNTNINLGSLLPQNFSSVFIGEGTFLGVNCVILPNVRIGKGCIIGAGSVVNKDIPDFSIVSGPVAQIISKYNPQREKWE